jgi:hypothetical protein
MAWTADATAGVEYRRAPRHGTVLKDRDLRRVLAFVRDIYAQPDLGAFIRRVVERLVDIVAGHRISYNEVTPAARYIACPHQAGRRHPATRRPALS